MFLRERYRMETMFCLILVVIIFWVPSYHCQLALASSSFIKGPSASALPRKTAALSKGLNFRDTRSRPLFTKYSDLNSPLRVNTSSMEMEIAAIFKEFAYGSSLAPSDQTSTTTTSSTTTWLPWYTTKSSLNHKNFKITSDVMDPKKFIGEQREVYSEIYSTTKAPTTKVFTSSTKGADIYYGENEPSYLVNTEGKENELHNKDSVENFPNFLDNVKPTSQVQSKNDVPNIPIVSTTATTKNGFLAIQEEIGKAWSFHVYATGISFCFVAAICLLSLSRVNSCCHLLPRGYFIILHLMVFLASFLRAVLFLRDPYGAYGRLPSVLKDLLFNSVNPCLTTAFAVVFLVLLRAARIRLVPLNMQSPLVLATICGIHIGGSVVVDVSSGVLEEKSAITTLNIVTQSFTVIWGCLLCLGYILSFGGIEKSAQRQQSDLVRLTFNRKGADDLSQGKAPTKSALVYVARLFLICTLLHALIIAFIILNLVNTEVPYSVTSSEAWAWWTQSTLERIVEIVLCALLLVGALILTHTRNKAPLTEKDDRIFSVLSHYKGTTSIGNVDLYPGDCEKGSIYDSRSIRHSTLNMSNDCHSIKKQIKLNSPDNLYKNSQADSIYGSHYAFSPNHIGNSNYNTTALRNGDIYRNFAKRIDQNISPNGGKQILDLVGHYPSITSRETLKYNMNQCHQLANHLITQHSPTKISNPPYYISAVNCGNKPINDYEISPYYNSNASTTSHLYTKPYTCVPGSKIHKVDLHQCTHKSQKNEHFYKSRASVGSSQSEIHVDYLTDMSSSNDALSNNTLSNIHTLPLYSQYCLSNDDIGNRIPCSNSNEISTVHSQYIHDSAEPNFATTKGGADINTNPLSFLRVSTSSLNEALKNHNGILGKLHIPGKNVSNYAPLYLDDSISSPSTDYTILRKSISTGDLTDTKSTRSESLNENSLDNVSYSPKQLTMI